MATLTFSNNRIKKPYRSRDTILTIHSPKKYCVDIANTMSIDTETTIKLPVKTTVYLAIKFKGQKITKIEGLKTQRLWLTLLNESYFDEHKIQIGDIIGYLVVKPSNLQINYEKPKVKTRKLPNNYIPQKWDQNWKTFWQKKETNGRVSQQI